jgi:kinesin family protein 11
LIREYTNEIERLKADLSAARDKYGIYLSSETYESMMNESQSQKDRIGELAKIIEARIEQLKQTEQSFADSKFKQDFIYAFVVCA